jgi:hypothetical protein
LIDRICLAMSEQEPSDDRIWRALADRTRALQRLDSIASTAVGKTLAGSFRKLSALVTDLAEMLIRDLTAIGLMSHDRTGDAVLGGGVLTVSPDVGGVLISWTQHDASVAVLDVPCTTRSSDRCGSTFTRSCTRSATVSARTAPGNRMW